jgi:bifunctional oligoribonuclease and PAP phosphatase NrnA
LRVPKIIRNFAEINTPNSLNNTDFKDISVLLDQPADILVTTHTNPDGDAVGASLAMYGYLVKKGHNVAVMIPDPDPAFLHWMPFHEKIRIFSQEKDACIDLINKAKIIFCLDFNSLRRLSDAEIYVRNAPAIRILLDHHLNPAAEFHHMISIPHSSSTSEIVYDFIEKSGHKNLIDKEIAACIYAGIVTDTGSFSYSCDFPKTYEITAELVKTGIDGEHIHRLVYDTYSESRLRLLGYSLSEKLVVLPEYNTAYISLSLDELNRFNHQNGDTEGVVNYALSIAGINLAGLFYEREDGLVKVSLRSKGHFAVNEIARIYFNGGGHANAAGANANMSLDKTVSVFRELLPKYGEQLKSVY